MQIPYEPVVLDWNVSYGFIPPLFLILCTLVIRPSQKALVHDLLRNEIDVP